MIRRVLVFSFLALVLPWRADAHRLDELLQATRISVDAGGIQLELALSPGVDVADEFIRSIDRNRDGALDDGEVRDFGRRVVGALTLSVDEHPLTLSAARWHAEPIDALRQGVGTIRLVARAAADMAPGRHVLMFGNGFQRAGSVYLVNALTPADSRIHFGQPQRDAQQRTFTIDYVRTGSWPAVVWPGAVTAVIVLIAIGLTARSSLARSAREIPRELAGGNRATAAGVLPRPQR